MRGRILICFAGALFATICTDAQIATQTHAPEASAVQGEASAPTYAETPDGLMKLVQDLYEAEKAGDTKRSSDIYTTLLSQIIRNGSGKHLASRKARGSMPNTTGCSKFPRAS